MSQDNGMEIEVPGIARLKNLKYPSVLALWVLTAAVVALAVGGFNHDANAAKERGNIVTAIQTAEKQRADDSQALKAALERQNKNQELQNCLMFLSLDEQKQARIRASNPQICR